MPDETPARDEMRTIRASNETAGRKGETLHGTHERDDRRDERQEAGRDEMMRERNRRLLANLPTCQLANLLLYFMSCYTYYAFSWIR